MLTFLAFCSMQKLTLDSYIDEAVGFLEKGENGKPILARIELHPKTTFADGIEVSPEKLAELHHKAHQECFLANSVKTEINNHPLIFKQKAAKSAKDEADIFSNRR